MNGQDYAEILNPESEQNYSENSLYRCLANFTAEELLSAGNAYECEKCCAPFNKKVNIRDGKGSNSQDRRLKRNK